MEIRDTCQRPWGRTAFAALFTMSALAVFASSPVAQAGQANRPAEVDPATPRGVQPLGTSTAQTLIWSDEFTGTSLNTSKWNTPDQERTEAGRSDGIRWWYKPANVRVISDNGGNLAIDLKKLATDQYSGGRVDSNNKFEFTYGTIEARIHTPARTDGHLTAFWMNADTVGNVDGSARDGAEVDLVETAYQADQYAVTVHYDGYGAAHRQSSQVVNAPGLHSTWYHTFKLTWTPTAMTFFYDGSPVRTITDANLISQVKEYPILSHELLQWADGSLANAPLDYNSTMYVDYIRVWQ